MILYGEKDGSGQPVLQIAMPRSPRIYAPRGTMHVVARCNDRKFYFGTQEDFQILLDHLGEMSSSYAVKLFGYTLMSNHLLVADDGERDVIPNSMQLVAGGTGQNLIRERSEREPTGKIFIMQPQWKVGIIWHNALPTLILTWCAGVVTYPSMWPFSGYNQIQEPRRKNVLIDYERLQGLLGAGTYDQLRSSHKGWVEEYLGDGEKARQEEWADSIAVGSRPFVEKVKAFWGYRAKGRDIIEGTERYQVREGPVTYNALIGAEKRDIGP
jgi:putative transposase